LKDNKHASLWMVIAIVLIVVFGAWLRTAYNSNTFFISPIRADAAFYFQYAHNLVEHTTFSKERSQSPTPDSYWAPGYPILVALNIYGSKLVAVEAYDLVLHMQTALAALTILLVFLIGRLFLPSYWPLLPATLLSISPHHISLGSYALTETAFGFFLCFSIYFFARGFFASRNKNWGLAGLGAAVAYAINPVCLVAIPTIAILISLSKAWRNDTGIQPINTKHIVVIMLPVVIFFSAWSLRTAISVPDDQPTSSDRLLTNLTIGLYPDFHEKWRAQILNPEEDIRVPGEGVDTSYSSFFNEVARQLSSEPTRLVSWFILGKPYQLWQWDILTGQGDIYVYDILYSLYHTSKPALVSYSIMHSLHHWLLICSLLGIGLVVANHRNSANSLVPMITYGTMCSISLVYIATQAEPRYSVPLRPELYLTATYFIWQLYEWVKNVRENHLVQAKN
jgi:4-amino-4-deoxy-L-arabinose transferase-like glycosyltransferase